jgi:hypothetical protein
MSGVIDTHSPCLKAVSFALFPWPLYIAFLGHLTGSASLTEKKTNSYYVTLEIRLNHLISSIFDAQPVHLYSYRVFFSKVKKIRDRSFIGVPKTPLFRIPGTTLGIESIQWRWCLRASL